jgi:hypothetical protein
MFFPSEVFSTIINTFINNGEIHYVGVNPGSNPITGQAIKLGTFYLKAGSNEGEATVGFSSIHINASGVEGALPINTENTKNGIYTIGNVEATINPSTSPTVYPCGNQGPVPEQGSPYSAYLFGSEEVPPNSSGAEAIAWISLSSITAPNTTAYVYLNFCDTLIGERQISAHIHGPAAPGQTAPPIITLPEGKLISHQISLTPTQLQQLQQGLLYINVHTNEYPDGEIRGQIVGVQTGNDATPSPTPGPISSASDLNDDGKVDELDLNLLYVGFSNREGD